MFNKRFSIAGILKTGFDPLKHLVLACLLLAIVTSCKSEKKEPTDSASTQGEILNPDTRGNPMVNHALWIQSYRMSPDSLKIAYTDNPVKVMADGTYYQGVDSILAFYRKYEDQVVEIIIDTLLPATEGYSYEIGGHINNKGDIYRHLIIWNTAGDIPLRELEFTVEKGIADPAEGSIRERRELWLKYCNDHNVADLVRELYTENALYYNHKPMVVGWDELMDEYRYMNHPDYQLSLEPIYLEHFNDSISVEIGQCSGNYNGKYILVWQKGSDGQWRILMDSNI